MAAINHTLRLTGASLLALLLGAYLYSPPARAAARDISHVNRSIHVEAGGEVGNVSSVNGRIEVNRGASAKDLDTVNARIRIDGSSSVLGEIHLYNVAIFNRTPWKSPSGN